MVAYSFWHSLCYYNIDLTMTNRDYSIINLANSFIQNEEIIPEKDILNYSNIKHYRISILNIE
jgi:hypothetical protein